MTRSPEQINELESFSRLIKKIAKKESKNYYIEYRAYIAKTNAHRKSANVLQR